MLKMSEFDLPVVLEGEGPEKKKKQKKQKKTKRGFELIL